MMRDRIAQLLRVAYGDGLLSEATLAHRLDLLCGSELIEPAVLIGDLRTCAPPPRLKAILTRAAQQARELISGRPPDCRVLALDWAGTTEQVTVGRHGACDVVLDHPTVSRRHAQLRYRDGRWVLQDLESTNGTLVNGAVVGRCLLRPGDELELGDVRLVID